jgi:2-oxopent-4-enoate hydratase
VTGPEAPTLSELADRLWTAETDRRPIAPLTTARPDLALEDAYAIQNLNIERQIGAGRVVRGHKVGLTSRAMQDLLDVGEPTYGVLLDGMFVEEGDEVRHGALIQPRVEAEIAFVMGSDLSGPGVTTTQALGAIDGALPAIEIADSRIANWQLKLVDTVADNASTGRLVLGARITPVHLLDLRLVGMLFYRNDVPIDSGAGAAALGHPARCVAWLANKLGSLGTGLSRGDIVLSGALHRMVPVRAGDVVRAEFAHLGAVSAYFSDKDSAA